MKPIIIWIFTVLGALTLCRCSGGEEAQSAQPDSVAPTVVFSTPVTQGWSGDKVILQLSAIDNKDPTPDASISCNSGLLTGYTLILPETTSSALVHCTATVTDHAGNTATRQLNIQVKPVLLSLPEPDMAYRPGKMVVVNYTGPKIHSASLIFPGHTKETGIAAINSSLYFLMPVLPVGRYKASIRLNGKKFALFLRVAQPTSIKEPLPYITAETSQIALFWQQVMPEFLPDMLMRLLSVKDTIAKWPEEDARRLAAVIRENLSITELNNNQNINSNIKYTAHQTSSGKGECNITIKQNALHTIRRTHIHFMNALRIGGLLNDRRNTGNPHLAELNPEESMLLEAIAVGALVYSIKKMRESSFAVIQHCLERTALTLQERNKPHQNTELSFQHGIGKTFYIESVYKIKDHEFINSYSTLLSDFYSVLVFAKKSLKSELHSLVDTMAIPLEVRKKEDLSAITTMTLSTDTIANDSAKIGNEYLNIKFSFDDKQLKTTYQDFSFVIENKSQGIHLPIRSKLYKSDKSQTSN